MSEQHRCILWVMGRFLHCTKVGASRAFPSARGKGGFGICCLLEHSGGAPMTMQIARKVINYFRQIQRPSSDVEKLTPKEQEVLALLANGSLYKQIASDLHISINTLRVHIRTIYDKLHVHSRTEATVKYLGNGRFHFK